MRLLPIALVGVFALGLCGVFLETSAPYLLHALSDLAPLLLGTTFAAFMVRALVVSRSPPPPQKPAAAPAPPPDEDDHAAHVDHHKQQVEAHRAHEGRSPLQKALEDPFMQVGVLLLIFSDVATTLCELMLSEVCPAPPHGSHAAHDLEHWEERLAWTGRAMLGVLMLHQVLLLYAYGADFWHHKMHVLDFVICSVAVGLEAMELRAGEGVQHEGAEDNKDEALCVAGEGALLALLFHARRAPRRWGW